MKSSAQIEGPQPGASGQNKRVGVIVGCDAGLSHEVVERYCFGWVVASCVASDDGVPVEHVWVGHLGKDFSGVI